MIATICTKHVARGWVKLSVRRPEGGASAGLTWLEEERIRYFYIPRVATWLNPLRLSHERTHDECGGLADVVKRAELDHR
jgi:hypothetical protein